MALPRRLLLSPNYQLVTDTPHGEGLTNGDWRESLSQNLSQYRLCFVSSTAEAEDL